MFPLLMVHLWACSRVGEWVLVNWLTRLPVRKTWTRILLMASKCLPISKVWSKLSNTIHHPSKPNSDKKLAKDKWPIHIMEACLKLPYKCKRIWILVTTLSFWLKDRKRLSPRVKWLFEGEKITINLWFHQVQFSRSKTRMMLIKISTSLHQERKKSKF